MMVSRIIEIAYNSNKLHPFGYPVIFTSCSVPFWGISFGIVILEILQCRTHSPKYYCFKI